jgi:hypothetical protein
MNNAPFEALADGDRRRLLSRLAAAREGDEPLRVPEDVMSETAAAVADAGADRRAVALRFHHVHLPKLTELGYVTWDRSAGTVQPGPAFDEIAPLLAAVESDGDDDERSVS